MQKANIINHIKKLLYYSGSVKVARIFGKNGKHARILTYHSISEEANYCPNSIALPQHLFKAQLKFLAEHYQVISLDDLVQCINKGSRFPDNAVVLTFDDGYKDNYEHAYPLLQETGITATFYITTSPILNKSQFWVAWIQEKISLANIATIEKLVSQFNAPKQINGDKTDLQALIDFVSSEINRSDLNKRNKLLDEVAATLETDSPLNSTGTCMMNTDQVREMAQNGMTIAAHTETHPILTSISDDDIKREITTSRDILREITDTPINHFSHPNGPGVINHSQHTAKLIKEAGFHSAVTSVRGTTDISTNPFLLRRQGIHFSMDTPAFAFKLEEHQFSNLLFNYQLN